MRVVILIWLSITIILVFGCNRSDDNTTSLLSKDVQIDPKVTSFLNKFEQTFYNTLQRSGAPGAVVSVVVDTSKFSKGFGIRDMKTRKKVDQHTLFRIGSLSKGFAAVLAGIVAADGDLSFNEKVQQIVPQFKLKDSLQTRRIEVKHILSHSTGLPRHAYTNLVEADVPMDQIIQELGTVELIAEEGKIYSYQNAAFGLIENILKNKTGHNFRDLLLEKIFRPAKMTRSTTKHLDLITDSNVALPHLFASREKGFVRGTLTDKYFNLTSTGGIALSGNDMSTWLSILLGNYPEIIDNDALDKVFEPVLPTNSRKYYDRWSDHPTEYALGWRKIDLDSTQIMHHTGFVNNYRSEIAIDRKNKIAVCVLFNSFVAEAKEIVPAFLSTYGEQVLVRKNIAGDRAQEILPAN